MLTYRDVVDHVLDYMGGNITDPDSERLSRRAVQCAVNEFHSKRNWTCFYKRGRIITSPPYATGTIQYQATSGSVPRQITLTGGTWPSFAGSGVLIINNILYPVWAMLDSATLQLQEITAPAADIDAGTSFQLVQENYPLPVDFGQIQEIVNSSQGGWMTYLTPGEFMAQQRQYNLLGVPYSYTYQNDPLYRGTLAIAFYPFPDIAYTMDMFYRRQSRALSAQGAIPVVAYTVGTASASTQTVTGTGTAWTPGMAGCVIRFAAQSNGDVPTGQGGSSPFAMQRMVTGVTNAQTLTIDQVPDVSFANVPYAISDPVDLEFGAMMTYFLRECEKQIRILRRISPQSNEDAMYANALIAAFEADQRHNEARATFGYIGGRRRISGMPSGPNVGG